MATRIEKPVTIARSGVYQYLRQELPGFKLPAVPDQHANLKIFNVYRPATVLAAAKDLFAKVPIIREHQAEVTPGNFQELTQGWTGDSVEAEMLEGKDEVAIKSTVNILNEEGIALYEAGQKEVSPYYFGKFSWKDGMHEGVPYQVIMDSIDSVNHLAMVRRGRGGQDAVIDHAMRGEVKYKTALMRTAKRMAGVAKDSEPEEFYTSLTRIIKTRMMMTEDMINAEVNKLRECAWDLPASDDRELLLRFLDDVQHFRNEENDTVVETAGKMIADLYAKLDDVSILDTMKEQEKELAKMKDSPEEEDKDKMAKAKDAEGKEKEGDVKDNDMQLIDALKAFLADWKPSAKAEDAEPDEKDDKDKADEKAKAKDAEAETEKEPKKPSEKVDTEKETSETKGRAGDSMPASMRMIPESRNASGMDNPYMNKYLRKETK